MKGPAEPDPIALVQHAFKDSELFHATMAALQKLSPKSLFDEAYDDLKAKGMGVVDVGMMPNATREEKLTAIVTLCALAFMSRVMEYQDLLAEAAARKEKAES